MLQYPQHVLVTQDFASTASKHIIAQRALAISISHHDCERRGGHAQFGVVA
jgi:hypothetical protein